MESGRTLTVFSVEAAEEYRRQSEEHCTFEVQEANVIYGSRDTVGEKLADIQIRYQVDELIIQTVIPDFKKRLHSYELLGEMSKQVQV